MVYQPPSFRRLVRRAAEYVVPHRILVSRVPAAGSRVALTFDDGPDPLTGTLLDRLDEVGILATFFLVGRLCDERREAVLEIVRRGHEVAGHGYTHKRFPDMTADELRSELRRTNDALPPSVARSFVRPPHGALHVPSLAHCAAQGFTTVMWSLDSRDANHRDAATVADNAGAARAGDIVLMHEGQQWTIEALPEIARRVRARGLDFCRVSDLLRPAG